MKALRWGLFWFFSVGVGGFSLVVLSMALLMGIEAAAPHLQHYFAPYRLPLYAHMIFGPLALVLAPFQFWAGLRNRRRALHGAMGYAYVIAVTFAGIGALALLPRFAGSLWAATGFAILAAGWLFTTLRAVMLARAGDTAQHRIWMMRAASLTFAAVVLRLITLPLMGTGMTLAQSYDITAWASWLIPLLTVELIIRRSRAPVATPAT